VKKILPVIIGVVLAGGGFLVYTMFLSGGGGKPETPAQAQAKAAKLLATTKKQRLKDAIEGPIVTAGDPFVVNLSDPGLSHFAKFSVSLRADVGSPLEKVEAGAAGPAKLEEADQVRDLIISAVSSHSSSELSTVAGRDELKKQIIKSINAETAKTVVLDVYITDFAIQ
jgi:flagellar basal body-associated protein FliL